MSFTSSARKFALDKALEFEREGKRVGILRSVDATHASRFLIAMAKAIRESASHELGGFCVNCGEEVPGGVNQCARCADERGP